MSILNWLKRLFVPEAPPPRTIRETSSQPATLSTATRPSPSPPRTTPDPAVVKKPPSPPKKFNLDADDFLPISRSELIQQAKAGGRSWWGVWFGMRDRIPPATDSRTKLIDRAMVAQGLLTPEQLVEIHRVGDEMERLRPSFDSMRAEAARVGESAVEADREARRARKEQKKQEAAERKRLRAERIAEHKRTDILYLGRRVSHQLGQRESDAALLQSRGLPFLATPTDLATALQLTIPQLRWLAYHSEVTSRIHYILFSVPKRSGGTRQLAKAHRRLAAAQRWILENILRKLHVEPSAHGFVKERSTLTNAQPHAQQDVVVNLDLENFFPSVTFPRVRSVFKRCGYSPSVATILALLCTESPRKLVSFQGKNYYVAIGRRGLPQGACTSPAIANQVARRLDKRLNGLATKIGAHYTRYADDLTFSGSKDVMRKAGYLLTRIRHLAMEEGFSVNEEKTRVLRRNTAQVVTGLVVNEGPHIDRRELRKLRAILHKARVEGLTKQNRECRSNYRQWLEGMIAYVSMVQPRLGKKLHSELSSVKD